jgi:hypothetical protein
MTDSVHPHDIRTVLPDILERAGAAEAMLTLVCHPITLNWRQRFASDVVMLRNSDSALDTTAPSRVMQVSAEALPGSLPAMIEEAQQESKVVSLISRIRSTARDAHLSMMNLHPPAGSSMDEVMNAIRSVRPPGEVGRVFASGRFCHYYGSTLIEEEAWTRNLARWLMPSVLVSPRYIGHCVFQTYSSLRLSALEPLKPTVPYLVQDWF